MNTITEEKSRGGTATSSAGAAQGTAIHARATDPVDPKCGRV